MKNEDDFVEQRDTIDENLLDFEFEDLPDGEHVSAGEAPGSEEKIIELVDVVEEPGLDFEFEEKDLESLADEEIEEKAVLELEDLLEPEDLEAELKDDEAKTQTLSISDLKEEFEDAVKSQEKVDLMQDEIQDEIMNTDFDATDILAEDVSVFDGPEAEAGFIQEEQHSEPLWESEEASHKESPISELDASSQQTDEAQGGEEMIGISEERMETIIREVVGDIVERVARETMQSVAERLIGEAIDALKETLESTSE